MLLKVSIWSVKGVNILVNFKNKISVPMIRPAIKHFDESCLIRRRSKVKPFHNELFEQF